jgi:uncharacterized protein (TIGR03083 family)
MSDPSSEFLAAIARHSAGLADAADGNLAAAVEHCPGWTVADLVHHLTEVQWFWATIVEERLTAPPEAARRPARAEPDRLIRSLRSESERLVRALAAAPAGDRVYTWAPAQQDVAFITRHQVQEAAVHHWDAAHARGDGVVIEAWIAADAVEEFLTFSVSSDADPAEPPRPRLDGTLGFRAEAGQSWTVSDGQAPGTVTWTRGADEGTPTIAASAADLLLWLYGRIDVDTSGVAPEVVARFRALCFTD